MNASLISPEAVFEYRRSFTQDDFDRFAALSGDDNPIHVDPTYAARTHFGHTVAHGMLLYSVLSGTMARTFPGSVQLAHEMMFPTGTPTGEEVIFRMQVLAVEGDEVELAVSAVRPSGELGLNGRTRIRLSEDAR